MHVLAYGRTEYNQGLYLDRATMTLIPNQVFVNETGDFLFEVNSFGLRGPEPEPGQRLAVVWGDSVVFSVAHVRSWPEMMNHESIDCLFLNGGIEGSSYVNMLKRAIDLNRRREVAMNIVLPGWHVFPDNRRFRADLEQALDELPNAVLVTQPTTLNENIADKDLSAYLVDDGPLFYRFWSGNSYSVPLQYAHWLYICERNAVVRTVAQERSLPLVDLFATFYTANLDDFRTHFFDIGHPRPQAYATFASILREAVTPLLAP